MSFSFHQNNNNNEFFYWASVIKKFTLSLFLECRKNNEV